MYETLQRPGAPLTADRAPMPRHLSPDDFAPEVAERVHALDPDAYENVYIVGDVHGCRRELEALFDRLRVDDEDLVVLVGDLVRKGPDSRGVVEFVRAQPNVIAVRGNNEDKLIHGRKELATLDPHEAYLESLPIVILLGDGMVVHGGLDPRRALADHGIQDLLTFRSVPPEAGYDGPFWFEQYEGPTRVFFGHTVLDEPVVSEYAVGLDTGCVYGGALTAYDLGRNELVAVPAEQEYQPRADRKIVDVDAPSRG